MMVRLRQLSDENADKEQELRNAKYMVRGMEAEIQRLKTTTASHDTPRGTQNTTTTPASGQGGKPHSKSKLCSVL
jgi:hypothetical protein